MRRLAPLPVLLVIAACQGRVLSNPSAASGSSSGQGATTSSSAGGGASSVGASSTGGSGGSGGASSSSSSGGGGAPALCTGSVVWTRALGIDLVQTSGNEDPFSGFAVTPAGDILLTGRSCWDPNGCAWAPNTPPGNDTFFTRLDATGAIVGGSPVPGIDQPGASVIAAPDGGWLVSGMQGSDFGSNTAHLIRYDAVGQIVFHKTFVSFSLTFGDVAFLPSGHMIVTGYFRGQTSFDSIVKESWLEIASLFLGELDADGDVVFVKTFTQTDCASGHGLAIGADGDIFLSGEMGGCHVSPSLNLGGDTLMGGASFLARFTATGEHVWSKQIGASIHPLRFTPEGTLFVPGGSGAPTVDFGAGPVAIDAGSFLARLDLDGAPLAVQPTGLLDFAAVAPVPGGASRFVSPFYSAATIDVLGAPLASNAGSTDVLVGTIDAGGKMAGACLYGGPGEEPIWATGKAPDGAFLVAGRFTGTLDLGSGPVTSATAGDRDIFIAKILP